jgi:hypothetical protein
MYIGQILQKLGRNAKTSQSKMPTQRRGLIDDERDGETWAWVELSLVFQPLETQIVEVWEL